MDKIKKEYDATFCTYAALKRAHKNARRSKRKKTTVVRFEHNELENLAKLKLSLDSDTYKLKGYNRFYVMRPKKRQIQSIPYRDRIVQHIICDDVLYDHFTKKVIFDNAACVKGRGQHFATKRLKLFLRKFFHQHKLQGYFLKCDIKKYFPSLAHNVIKKIFSTEIEDERIRQIFDDIIDSYQTPIEFLDKHDIPLAEKKFLMHIGWRNVEIKRGVPIGNQTSQLIGLFYLNKIDRFIKETLKVKYYIRYMDDFILVHHDKEFLKSALEKIRNLLRKELRLELNSKTQIFPIKNGVKFLGFHFYLKKNGRVVTKVQDSTAKMYKSKIKYINKFFPCKFLDEKKAASILCSYKGHLKHSDSHGLVSRNKKLLKVKLDAKKQEEDVRGLMFADAELILN